MAAHYEHDIVVREGKAEILSTFDYIAELSQKHEKILIKKSWMNHVKVEKIL
jgi:methionyl aminopeptidase